MIKDQNGNEFSLPMDLFKNYRKNPLVIQALRIQQGLSVDTLEGTMKANIGDWLIIGVEGEIYPCKHEIFMKTYEKVCDKKGKDCTACFHYKMCHVVTQEGREAIEFCDDFVDESKVTIQ
jgi:hypothetical protein